MLQRGYHLEVQGQGLVPFAVSQGQSRIALDTGADAAFFNNPDLPDTRSEAALPLRARGQIIGALDVQSTAPQAFTQEDISVLQALADQVALAISNAQLFQQAQAGLEAERRAAAQVTQHAWQDTLHAQRELSVVKSRRGVAAGAPRRPEVETARRTGQVTLDESTRTVLAVPVKVRDQVIGVLDARKPEGALGATAWTPEEIALVETLTEQMGVALESARLYQDTQRRAAQERLVGEVTSRMRESLDMETVLRTAAQELRQALGVPELNIRLATPALSTPDKEASS
jgi:GAF domain-containing protein